MSRVVVGDGRLSLVSLYTATRRCYLPVVTNDVLRGVMTYPPGSAPTLAINFRYRHRSGCQFIS